MDDDREFQMRRKENAKNKKKIDDKTFIEYWKERMKELVNYE